jgi:ribosomal protein S18 acetylase RimI-like enzyme
MLRIRATGPSDEVWIRALLDERWGGQEQVANGAVYRPADLPGFVVEIGSTIAGYAALRVVGDRAEIGMIEALQPGRGVGTALVHALADSARARGCRTLCAITTNDNVVAQAFYAALGFRLVATRAGAVHESRKRKPEIPVLGADGTPITDELDFELVLEDPLRRPGETAEPKPGNPR